MNAEKLIGAGDLVSIGHQPKLYVVYNVDESSKCSLIGIEMNDTGDNERMLKYEEEIKYLVLHNPNEIADCSCLAAIQENVLGGVDMTSYLENV